MTPTTITRTTTHPKHAASPTDYDRVRESQARRSAEQGVHVALIGQRHYPEAAANIDMAASAWAYAEAHNTGRVA